MFKNIFPRKEDFQLCSQVLVQSLKSFPFLLKSNALYILFLLLTQYLFFEFVLPKDNPLFIQVSQSLWNMFYIMILIFTIPLHLYNKWTSPSSPMGLGYLVRKTLWPLAIDTMKVFALTFVVFIVTLLIIPLLYMLWIGIKEQSFSFTSSILLFIEHTKEYELLAVIIQMPNRLVMAQLAFVPFIIYFNKSYEQKQISSLKESIRLTRHTSLLIFTIVFLPIVICNVWFPFADFAVQLFEVMPYHFSIPILSIINVIFNLVLIAFIHILYIQKDSQT